MVKLGEVTLDLGKDVKKDAKENLNGLFSGYRNEITILADEKKATKVKVTIETV